MTACTPAWAIGRPLCAGSWPVSKWTSPPPAAPPGTAVAADPDAPATGPSPAGVMPACIEPDAEPAWIDNSPSAAGGPGGESRGRPEESCRAVSQSVDRRRLDDVLARCAEPTRDEGVPPIHDARTGERCPRRGDVLRAERPELDLRDLKVARAREAGAVERLAGAARPCAAERADATTVGTRCPSDPSDPRSVKHAAAARARPGSGSAEEHSTGAGAPQWSSLSSQSAKWAPPPRLTALCVAVWKT